MAVMPVPVVLAAAASKPTATLLEAVFEFKAFLPSAVLLLPVELLPKELNPTAVLLEPVVFENNAFNPTAVLLLPVVFAIDALLPNAVLLLPVEALNA